MAEHPHVEMMRKGYEAFGNGDLDTVRTLFADDIVWHQPGNNILSGDYKGVDEVFGLFGRLLEETGGNFRNDIHDILANDEHAAVMVNVHTERNGKTLDAPAVHIWHVKDGKATEFWIFGQNTQQFDEFWS